MKLVTFRSPAGSARVGALQSDGSVADLQAAASASLVYAGGRASTSDSTAAERVPGDMIAFFAAGRSALDAATEAVGFVGDSLRRGDNILSTAGHPITFGSDAARLLAPVPQPTRIRDYLTYEAHGSGSGLALPPAFSEMPICYKCNPLSVIGPEEEILWPSYTDKLDYELEIGFYIGKMGRNIRVEEAPEYIAAVTIFNDVSARDIQLREMTLTIGPSKGKDFCTVMGPCAVTMDEIDEWNLNMRARVNGEVWSEGTSRNRRFSFAEVVAWASYCETIYPGEFLAVGTVGGGCGLELNRWIRPGDIVELEVDGIGVLRNRVGEKETTPPGSGLKSYPGPIWERD
ncbi:MAG: fumarylacetoacetate hydrolase family protein [Tepidiformaceae bacterium]